MIRISTLLLLATAAALLAQSPTPSPSPSPSASPSPSPSATPVTPIQAPSLREIINNLKDDELDKAIQTLRETFLDPSLTDDKIMKRATLEGLIRRLSPGVVLVSNNQHAPEKVDTAFLAEILDSRIGYVRLGKLDRDRLVQMDAALTNFSEKKVKALVLDLRGIPSGGDYETVAEFARRFCPKGKLLFSLQKPSAKQERIFTSNQEPAFHGVTVVLTDAATTGAAEVLAATLRLNAGALIVGADTAGEALEFAEAPVGGGATLRVAVAQVILPAGAAIYPGGVKPDIAISLPATTQREIFELSKEKGVSQFVFDPERQRMNEAALVANTNPEIDGWQSQQRERGRTPLRDTVLQRAVDLVTAISFYKEKQ